MRDFGVPDTVKSISWCGENICLGIRKEYVILNTANGTLSEVFPSGRVSPPLVTSLPSGELLLGKVNLGVASALRCCLDCYFISFFFVLVGEHWSFC